MKTGTATIASQTLKIRVFVNAVISLIYLSGAVFAYMMSDWFGSDTFNLALIPFCVMFLYGMASFLLSYFQHKAAVEEEDRLLLEKRNERKRTFDSDEDILFTAARTLESYKKYVPYIISAVTAIAIGGAVFLYVRTWGERAAAPFPTEPTKAAFIAGVFALITFFLGVFCVGQSRVPGYRWLRPAGVWQILFSSMMVASVASILFKKYGIPQWDYYLSRTYIIIFAILAAELLINFTIEFYRPRTGTEDRPVFESRLLSIITEPGGILRNIADTLDYQFGFQVSGTWIYRFLERNTAPLILIWLLLFWTATIFDEVSPGYMGVRETFGERVSGPLESGFYLKLPWPIQKIRKFPVDRVQQIFIGPDLVDAQGKEKRPDVVLWTENHYAKEKPFLVAIDNTSEGDTSKGTKTKRKNTTSVALMSALVPVQYKIRPDKLIEYAYGHTDPQKMLKYISEKEISAYLASSDMMKVMSTDREKATTTIAEMIQKAVDKVDLGIDIVAVNLLDAHPPITVGGGGEEGSGLPQAFQDVIAAKEKRETRILEAKKYRAGILPAAEASAYKIISQAESYRNYKIRVAEAEMERFKKRIAGYKAMPEQYILNEKMKFLENECKNLRKYIVPASSKNDVYVINLEEKRRLDLIDLNDLKEEQPKKSNNTE